MEKRIHSKKNRNSYSFVWQMLKFADTTDRWLMVFGFLGAICDGLSCPILIFLNGKSMYSLSNFQSFSSTSRFNDELNKIFLSFVFLACMSFLVILLEGYCWTRTAERQAARMRGKYLKAILRQEVEYFDLKMTLISEVITSVSNDSLIIQDVISEKVPNFIMSCSTFVGNYAIAYFFSWNLALVALPALPLLIIPGILYGRTLMSLAMKMREEGNKATSVVEQAISSIRTVYSFVGERKTMAEFSAALESSVKLGLRQGLIKGLAIGSNGVTFAIWALLSWYGSKLAMSHGIPGSTVFAIGTLYEIHCLQVRSLIGDRMAVLIQTLSSVAIACTMGLVITWRLTLVITAMQPVIITGYYARKTLLKNMSGKAIKAQSESSKLASEAVSNLRTVAAFSSQDHILRLFEKAQEGPLRESVKQSWYAGFGLGASRSLVMCTWGLVFWYGGKLQSHGYITAKAVIQTALILVSTGRVIGDASAMTTDIARGGDAIDSAFAVLDRYTGIEPEDPKGHQPEKLIGNVDICDVDFAYPARPDIVIFNNFSLSIEAQRSTALVGQSGSGKSTIIGLIERFYDPLRGTINIDGKDIKMYHLRALRQHIALVGQEPILFAGTIKENIKYGSEEATEAEVERAVRVANAHDFISCLRDGYETSCGDKGMQLSGGQKQRIAIARAVLKNPAILLLDEATSALDSQSEKVVQEALERVMVGRTSVVVAHRLSTIQNCDVIVVLKKGMVVEKGSHASLLAKGPSSSYFSLVSLQQGSKAQNEELF